MSFKQINDENYMPKWMKEKLEREEEAMARKEKNKQNRKPTNPFVKKNEEDPK